MNKKELKMDFKSGRGGKRQGAGRPKGIYKQIKDPIDRRQTIGVRLPLYMVDWLKLQDQPAGRIIEAALLNIHRSELQARQRCVEKFGILGILKYPQK
jgi:hypothetical protein